MKNKLASLAANGDYEPVGILDDKTAQRRRRLRHRVLLVVRFLPVFMFLAFLAFVVLPEQERVANEATATASTRGETAAPLDQ